MKLVKLVYIAHGWYLALADKDLITEGVQAWKYGPVVPSVYRRFKHFGSGVITSFDNMGLDEISKDDTAFLDKVWDVYRDYNGLQLSTITHQNDTPWYSVFNPDVRSQIIPNDCIKAHYKQKVASNN